MIELTDEQKKVMLQLGRTDSVLEAVPHPIIEELINLGLLYWRSEDNIYFTIEGERVLSRLEEK